MSARGTLYGVGVGPGDPELVTLKAARIVAAAHWIAYPADGEGAGLARRIAAHIVPDGARELALHIPMRRERAPAQAAYDAAARTIAGRLDAGEDVAVLCAGDPFFYGSFMYLFARLAPRYPAEIVPGVSALTAAAARLRRPLAARDDVLRVVPATLGEARLRAELGGAEAVAIIKVGRHFAKVRALLDELGLTDRAAIVESATMAGERIMPLAAVPAGERPYFSTILVYAGSEPW